MRPVSYTHLDVYKRQFVDVAVDQGGCGETTKVTYHDDPIFEVDGVVPVSYTHLDVYKRQA